MSDASRSAGNTAREVNLSRRRAIAKLGAFGAYAAPTLTTLLLADRALATHDPGCAASGNQPPKCLHS